MGQDEYLTPYKRWSARHGTGFGVTLWASPESQRLRFRVFTEMCFLADRRVLDAGCSRGDFADYMLERDIPYARYIGVDGLADVIDYARKRDLPRSEFHAGDFVAEPRLLSIGRPDVVCISGSLNTMEMSTAISVLESAWAGTGEHLLFNFLSDRCGRFAPPQDDFARRLETMTLLDWAFSRTWAVSFRQDYFPDGHDATIHMRKA